MVEIPRNNEETNTTNPVGKTENFVSKHFVRLLVWLAVSGGTLAIFGPWLLYVTGLTGETDANLRLHILYVTGGTIAVLGLVETHRKNTVDHEKAKVEKENYEKMQTHQASVLEEQQRQFNVTMDQEREKIEADKAKSEQDYIRQVHAERRSRYATAIEQLSNDKASIRLGGVYTLVGLVDEWLADEKTIPDIEERRKEGQVIINNLCSYIRSPFLLAERAEQLDKPYAKDLQKDFGGDKEKFDADKRTFKQHKANLEEERQVRQSIIKEMREHLHNYEELGPWSDFNYDFSNAYLFYPIDFSKSNFNASSKFAQTKFYEIVNFVDTHFFEGADFQKTFFARSTNFSKANIKSANFQGAIFAARGVNFSLTTFMRYANFDEVSFADGAIFSGAVFADNVSFLWSSFTGDVSFQEVTFTEDVSFFNADFPENIDFSKSKFYGGAGFSETTLINTPYFRGAKFSNNINHKYYNFKDKGGKINTKEQEHNGVKFIIPKDAELFDPDGPFD